MEIPGIMNDRGTKTGQREDVKVVETKLGEGILPGIKLDRFNM